MLLDLLIHDGLREEGLVNFVVSHASVAHHVDDAVLAKLSGERKKQKKREKKKRKKKEDNAGTETETEDKAHG